MVVGLSLFPSGQDWEEGSQCRQCGWSLTSEKGEAAVSCGQFGPETCSVGTDRAGMMESLGLERRGQEGWSPMLWGSRPGPRAGQGEGGERYVWAHLLAFSFKCRTFSRPRDRASADGERPSAD